MNAYSSERKVILHLGWPKTGTTTLQKHAFNKLAGHRYLGKVPFEPAKAAVFFQLVHLVAYASEEKFKSMQGQLFQAMQELEIGLFGDVDPTVPAIISEEGFFSALLKPSDHQHHGYSTASLQQIVDRLVRLQRLWNVSLEILITERDPMELLHAYYAQLYHIISRFPGLGTFEGYIAVGTADQPSRDLGFRYLRPKAVTRVFRERFGDEHVFVAHMKDVFSPGMIHLGRLRPGLPDMPMRAGDIENKRSVSREVKVAHHRPIWEKKVPFRLVSFMKEMRRMYKLRHADHAQLEVMITARSTDAQRLTAFLERPGD